MNVTEKNISISQTVIWITVAFAIGIWCAYLVPWTPVIMLILFLAVLALAGWRLYQNKPIQYCLIILFFIGGIFRVVHSDYQGIHHISQYLNEWVVMQGKLSEIPKVTKLDDEKYKVSGTFQVQNIQRQGERFSFADGILNVTLVGDAAVREVRQSDWLQLSGRVMALQGYKNPGMYDFAAAMKERGISARMTVKQEELRYLNRGKADGGYKQFFGELKERMLDNMLKVMPKADAAILAGMLFGGYEGIPSQVVKDFATTGIVHILSVSGSHIALLAGLVTFFGQRLRNWIGFNEVLIPLFAGGIIILYGTFCGLTPPVLRSVIMGLISLGALCFGREQDAGTALCIAALGMLIYQPGALYDVSFQLSFAATAGLIFLYSRTLEKLTFLPKKIAEMTAVVIAAQIGVLPIIAWYFHSMPVISLAANVLITPVIVLVIPLGLLGCIMSLLSNQIASWLLVTSSLLVGTMVMTASFLAKVPGAKVYLPPMGLLGSGLYYSLVAWGYGYKPKSIPDVRELLRKYPTQLKWGSLFVFIVAFLWIYAFPKPLYVHFIDVGQGDSALVITPHGKTLLIDTGGLSGPTVSFDVGERVVVPYLQHYGVTHLDYLFLTHGHQDHAGGAAAVMENVSVKNVLLPRETPSQAVQNVLRKKGNTRIIPVLPKQQIELDGVMLEVIHASQEKEESRNKNEVSAVLRISYGKSSFLFTGDLESGGEMEILSSGKNIKSTVLKVGHHGSKTSSTDDFLRAVAPQYGVISVGENNSFGHPHPQTLERLAAHRIKVLRTDKQGALVFESDGNEINVEAYVK